MSGFGDRFRRAAAGVADALGLRSLGTTLVHVGPPEPLPPPPRSRPRRALPAPQYPVCPSCGDRHEPRLHPAAGGGLAAYGRTLLSDPSRPVPLGRDPVDQRPLLRDQVNAWRHGTPDPPVADQRLAGAREDLRTPPTYWWEERED
jgi:hypothetical protein